MLHASREPKAKLRPLGNRAQDRSSQMSVEGGPASGGASPRPYLHYRGRSTADLMPEVNARRCDAGGMYNSAIAVSYTVESNYSIIYVVDAFRPDVKGVTCICSSTHIFQLLECGCSWSLNITCGPRRCLPRSMIYYSRCPSSSSVILRQCSEPSR